MRFWTGEPVEHVGTHFQVHGFKLTSLPVQKPLEVWLGGVAPSELRRVGRLADGWLPSFVSPEEAATGRGVVEEAAAAAGRSIDQEHFGALIPFALGDIPDRFRSFLEQRRPGTDLASVVPSGIGAIKDLLASFVDKGFSKFVLVPILPSEDDRKDMELLASEVLPLQN